MPSSVGWDSGLDPSASIAGFGLDFTQFFLYTGSDVTCLRIAVLAAVKVMAVVIWDGAEFHSFAASMLKLFLEICNLQVSLKILFSLGLSSTELLGSRVQYASKVNGYPATFIDFHVSTSLICADSWLTDSRLNFWSIDFTLTLSFI